MVKRGALLNEKQTEWPYTLPESSNVSKWGQYEMRWWWNVITHALRVQIGRGEFGITLSVEAMALDISWQSKLVETRLVWNGQHMGCYYSCPEDLNWSKPSQSQITRKWNGITHYLRVQIGQHKVGTALEAGARMALHTHWEVKLVKTKSGSNWQHIEWYYTLPVHISGNGSVTIIFTPTISSTISAIKYLNMYLPKHLYSVPQSVVYIVILSLAAMWCMSHFCHCTWASRHDVWEDWASVFCLHPSCLRPHTIANSHVFWLNA